MKKIAFVEVSPWEREILQNYPDFLSLIDIYSEKITEENVQLFQDYEVISSFIYSDFNQKTIPYLKKLKLIVTRSVGTDHIDLTLCQKNNILVKNIPDYGSQAVAEYTFGLLLCLMRKIYQAYHQVREKGSFEINNLTGEELYGKTLGVIGTGRIGRKVINIAKGFQMNILAYDKYPDNELAQNLGFKYVDFEELLKNSDILTFHIPYNSETHHLLNKNNISLIKRGAYLINTSRGGIIETEALYLALKNNILKGAALDVLEEEEDIKEEGELLTKKVDNQKMKNIVLNHILIDMENVLISPHNAFNTFESLNNIIKETIAHILNFLK
ncbi:MAG: NAD(P)-dependent oxidoreductase [Minisyncoccia bacterium]